MIKKWVEYIKESFEQLTHTEEDVLEYTRELIDVEIDNIFIDVHQEFNTSSGDITPEQTMRLYKLKEDLSKLITEQVTTNIELKNQKSDKIELEELSQLEDERDSVGEGDEVIAVYFDGGYSIYKFKVQLIHSSMGRPGNLGHIFGNKDFDIRDAYLVVKVDTYNDFVSDKRL